jgi:YjbE family integral membrane protein
MFIESELAALATVIVIDLVLAGDNAIVVGMAAAGLPPELRRKAIVIGIAAAALLRIVFAIFTAQLLNVIGLILAGGLLLLWVSWKLWRELYAQGKGHPDPSLLDAPANEPGQTGASSQTGNKKTLKQALIQIVVADVSMSLDNVLAVTLVARILKRYPWISYVGLVLIAWVAISMIWEGGWQVFHVAHRAGMI